MADELREHIVGLGIWRKVDSELGQLEQIVPQPLLEWSEIQDPTGRSRPRGKQVDWPCPRRMDEAARSLVHGQATETVSEERKRPIEDVSHLGYQLVDELTDVGYRLFVDAAEPPGRLDRHNLDGRGERLPQIVIHGRAAAGEWKAEQAQPRRHSRAARDEPTPDSRWHRRSCGLRSLFFAKVKIRQNVV